MICRGLGLGKTWLGWEEAAKRSVGLRDAMRYGKQTGDGAVVVATSLRGSGSTEEVHLRGSRAPIWTWVKRSMGTSGVLNVATCIGKNGILSTNVSWL